MSHIDACEFHAIGLPYATIGELGEILDGYQKIVWEAVAKNAKEFLPRFEKIYERINGRNPKKIVIGKKLLRSTLCELGQEGWLERIERARNGQGQLKGYVQYRAVLPDSLLKDNAQSTTEQCIETSPEPVQGTQGEAIEVRQCEAIDTLENNANVVIEQALGVEGAAPRSGDEAPQEDRTGKSKKPDGEAIIRHNDGQYSPNGQCANVGEPHGVIIKKDIYNNQNIKTTARDSSATPPATLDQQCPIHGCTNPQIPHIDTGQGPHFCDAHRVQGLALIEKHKSKRPKRSGPDKIGNIVLRRPATSPKESFKTPHRAPLSDFSGDLASNRAQTLNDEVKPLIAHRVQLASGRNGDRACTGQGLRRRIDETMQGMRRAYVDLRRRLL